MECPHLHPCVGSPLFVSRAGLDVTSILTKVRWNIDQVLNLHFSDANDSERFFFSHLLAICISLFENCLLISLAH